MNIMVSPVFCRGIRKEKIKIKGGIKMKKLLVAMIAVLMLSGCVNGQWKGILGYVDHVNNPDPVTVDTSNVVMPASGMPEVVLCNITSRGMTKRDIMERLMGTLHSSGQVDVKMTDYEILLNKPMEGHRNAFMYGSKYNRIPDERVIFTFTNRNNDCIYIGGRSQIVTNPNSPHERITDTTRTDNGKMVQMLLDQIKAEWETGGK